MSTKVSNNAYSIPDNCKVVLAVQKAAVRTDCAIPTQTDNVVWVFFPRVCWNPNAINNDGSIWIGFPKATLDTIKHTQDCTNNSIVGSNGSNRGVTTTSGTVVTSNGITVSSGTTSGCRGACSACAPRISGSSTSGVTCPTGSSHYRVNLEIKEAVAQTHPHVGRGSCPSASAYFINLDNRKGYHAAYDDQDSTTGVDLMLPECTGGSANVVYSFTDQAAICSYRNAGFTHACSSEARVPVDRINHLFGEVGKYISQNPAVCDDDKNECFENCYRPCPSSSSSSSSSSSCSDKKKKSKKSKKSHSSKCKCSSCRTYF